MAKSQMEAVIEHLREKGSITSIEAFEKYGCTRLSAKIYDLRHRGFEIRTEEKTSKNRYGTNSTYAEYVYEGEANENYN